MTCVAAATGAAPAPAQAQAQASAARGAVVRTDGGPVRGTLTADQRSFQGIPYAAPPVGELRWRSPQPPSPWADVRDATRPGNFCAQTPDPLFGQPAHHTEDCLYVNVTTPRKATRPLPVMVWLHGGSFTHGAGHLYDPAWFVKQGDVVVVTVNYRLGAFGFFGHADLPGSGAFGLEDQQAALRWVQRNIRAFGGNPRNVTLFGESAGGMSTCAHLASPRAAGLFHKAIIQSGACTVNWPRNLLGPGTPDGATLYGSPEEVRTLGAALMAGRGCATVDCLRAVPAADLLADPKAAALSRPMYGSAVLPEHPATALKAGRTHRVPLMMGATRDEDRLFAAATSPNGITAEQYRSLLDTAFAHNAPRVAERYPLADYESPGVAWATVSTDRVWSCPTLTANRSAAPRMPVYGFEFADRGAPEIIPPVPGLPLGAYHGSDVLFLFPFAPEKMNEAQHALSRQVIAYWTRFARTGDPNGPGSPHWARFRAGGDAVQAFEPGPGGVRRIDFDDRHQCGFWDSLR